MGIVKDLAPDNWQGLDEQGVGLRPGERAGAGGRCLLLPGRRARQLRGSSLCALEILQWLLGGEARGPWLEEDFAVGGEEVHWGLLLRESPAAAVLRSPWKWEESRELVPPSGRPRRC